MSSFHHENEQGWNGNLRKSAAVWEPPLIPNPSMEPRNRYEKGKLRSKDSRIDEEVRGGDLKHNEEVRLINLGTQKSHWVPPVALERTHQTQEQSLHSQNALNTKIRNLEDWNTMLLTQVECLWEKNLRLMNEVRLLKLEKVDTERELSLYRQAELNREAIFDSPVNANSNCMSSNANVEGDDFLANQRLESSFISCSSPLRHYDTHGKPWNVTPTEDYQRNHDELTYDKIRGDYQNQGQPPNIEPWREPNYGLSKYVWQLQVPSKAHQPVEELPSKIIGHHVNPNIRFDRRHQKAVGRKAEQQSEKANYEHRDEKPESDQKRYGSSSGYEEKQQSCVSQGLTPVGHDAADLGKEKITEILGGKDGSAAQMEDPNDEDELLGTSQKTRPVGTAIRTSQRIPNSEYSPSQSINRMPQSNQRQRKEQFQNQTSSSPTSSSSDVNPQSKSNNLPATVCTPPPPPAYIPRFTDPGTPSSSDVESDMSEPVQQGWKNSVDMAKPGGAYSLNGRSKEQRATTNVSGNQSSSVSAERKNPGSRISEKYDNDMIKLDRFIASKQQQSSNQSRGFDDQATPVKTMKGLQMGPHDPTKNFTMIVKKPSKKKKKSRSRRSQNAWL